ncbi:MAG: iron ABC transporter permease [Acidobacteriota bacterium]|nr:iron ABC transporter permease [Acidobacteriota bacterium]
MRSPIAERAPYVVAAFGVLVASVLIAPLIGSSNISFARVFDFGIPYDQNVDRQIFFIARLPRALAAAIVGASLAAAGVVFQALLRNPLATPYTLGVSTGASLGAMLAITFGWSLPGVLSRVLPAASAAALIGAMGSVLIVYWLARARHSGLSTTVLLLAGVTLNAFFSALILFVQYIGNFADVYRAMRWLMGNLDVSSYGQIAGALPFVALAAGIFVWLAKPLNLMAAGVDAAESRGLDVQRTQRLAFFSASVITGAAVSIGGPIGFVGIIVPHLVRLVAGADHRIVLPASAFVGGAFLVGCDVIARTILAPVELPVGIVTATIGGPFFLWMLIRRS